MPPPQFIQLGRGWTNSEKLLLRLSQFDRLARKPLNAGLGAARDIFAAEVGSRKAARAMKVRVYRTPQGLTGKVGPVGGQHRPGFLAALFLEKGTGLFGPKKRRITARSGGVLAFPSQALTRARFGPSASLFTASGRISKKFYSRFGNAGMQVVASTAGSRARPWFDRATRRSAPRISERFREKLREEMRARG